MSHNTDLTTEVTALESATWRALMKTGPDLIPYITDDCIMQFPLGLKLTSDSKPSVTDILHSETFVPWKDFALENVDVTPVGAEGAVISYLVKASRSGSIPVLDGEAADVEVEMLCSSVWRLKTGPDGREWKMCFHQQTPTTV